MNELTKCPVMHGAITTSGSSSTANRDWWPSQLNLSILHQHDKKSSPMADGFDYREEFKKLANLPNKEESLSVLVTMLNSPMQKLASTLNAPLQSLAGVLNNLKEKKS